MNQFIVIGDMLLTPEQHRQLTAPFVGVGVRVGVALLSGRELLKDAVRRR